MTITINDLKNASAEIEARYYELGGKAEFLNEFMDIIKQSIEFDLTAEWVETPLGLVGQWFTDRFAGKKQKVRIADVMAEGRERRGEGEKTFSTLDKRWI